LNIKRILIVGSNQVWSLERVYQKHLRALGLETELFAAQDLFYRYYNKSLFNKLLFRSGLSTIYSTINEALNEMVRVFKPELIWVFKGMELMPSTLNQLKKQGIVLVNYNPDNPFYFSSRGSGNVNVTNSIGLYDIHFTYDRGVQKTIQNEIKLPCFILPFGFELSSTLYEQCTRQVEVHKLCFIGNPDKYRVHFLEKIADSMPLDVYGNHWDHHTHHKGITVHPPVYGDDFWKALYRYRVQLNIMRPHNPASHNMRSFEIPGVGGIGLYPDTIDHREYLGNEQVVALFTDTESCIKQATAIMNMTPQAALELRNRARKVSLSRGYDYMSRTIKFLTDIRENRL